MNNEDMELLAKWQPIMLILNKRLECECGAMAVFVSGEVLTEDDPSTEDKIILDGVTPWCQACFIKAQQELEEK